MAPKLVLYLSSVLATQLIALGGQRLQRIITTRVHRDITLLSLNSADQKGEEDLYELLGVPPDASDRVIRGAYHLVASRIHPDKRPQRFASSAAERTALLNHAYSVLRSPALRAQYDQERARHQAGKPENAHGSQSRTRRGFSWLHRIFFGFGAGAQRTAGTLVSLVAVFTKCWRALGRRGLFASRTRHALGLVACR